MTRWSGSLVYTRYPWAVTITVNVQEAKTRLSELLKRVEAGEEVVIARAGRPVAHLRRAEADITFGLLSDLGPVPEGAFAPLDPEQLAWWEQGHSGDPLG